MKPRNPEDFFPEDLSIEDAAAAIACATAVTSTILSSKATAQYYRKVVKAFCDRFGFTEIELSRISLEKIAENHVRPEDREEAREYAQETERTLARIRETLTKGLNAKAVLYTRGITRTQARGISLDERRPPGAASRSTRSNLFRGKIAFAGLDPE